MTESLLPHALFPRNNNSKVDREGFVSYIYLHRPHRLARSGHPAFRAGRLPVKIMWWVYILKSIKDGRYYTGYTSNIAQRLQQHNRGKVRSTRRRGPFRLVYKEAHHCKTEAIKRERQLKRYKGGNSFKRLINNDPIV